MMKKITALLLALMLVFSLAACGGTPSNEVEGDDHLEGDVIDAGNYDDGGSSDVGEYSQDWNDYADVFTLTYIGVTEAGEAVAFVMTEDESFAALVVADTETMESASFVGEMVFDEESGTYTIYDEESGLSLTFTAEFFDDNSVMLDMGDLGATAVIPCEQSEAFDLLNEIEIHTVAVA